MKPIKRPRIKKMSNKVSFDADTAQMTANVLAHGIAIPTIGYGLYRFGKGVKESYKQFRSMGRYMRGKKDD